MQDRSRENVNVEQEKCSACSYPYRVHFVFCLQQQQHLPEVCWCAIYRFPKAAGKLRFRLVVLDTHTLHAARNGLKCLLKVAKVEMCSLM